VEAAAGAVTAAGAIWTTAAEVAAGATKAAIKSIIFILLLAPKYNMTSVAPTESHL
jgi:hypothetical protein